MLNTFIKRMHIRTRICLNVRVCIILRYLLSRARAILIGCAIRSFVRSIDRLIDVQCSVSVAFCHVLCISMAR